MRGTLLCSEVQLVKRGPGYEDIKPLECKRWSCDYCGPRRRIKLIALAASGQPNKILTLTVNPSKGTGPVDRRKMLHTAWRNLTKRVLRQFALPPERRWTLKSDRRSARQAATIAAITAKTPRLEVTKLHYMAFVERTKLGEPHLHILLRCPFLPQDWIAEQMGEMIGAPICWIEQVNNTRKAISYVTKYVAKEPAQFGNQKRYWWSRDWEIGKAERLAKVKPDYSGVSVRRRRWEEVKFDIEFKGKRYDLLADGWLRMYDSHAEWDKATDRYHERAVARL